MARLTKEQKEILKQIARGKYIYPERDHYALSKAWEHFEKLNNEKLIKCEINPDDGPYYINFELTIDGQLELEACRAEKFNRRLSVAAFVCAAFAVILTVMQMIISAT